MKIKWKVFKIMSSANFISNRFLTQTDNIFKKNITVNKDGFGQT